MKLLNLWAILCIVFIGYELWGFINMLIFGSVTFHEPNLFILITEYLIALFMFAGALVIVYLILFKGYRLKLER